MDAPCAGRPPDVARTSPGEQRVPGERRVIVGPRRTSGRRRTGKRRRTWLSSSVMLSQASSVIHEGSGLVGWVLRSSTVPPRRKNAKPSMSRVLAAASTCTRHPVADTRFTRTARPWLLLHGCHARQPPCPPAPILARVASASASAWVRPSNVGLPVPMTSTCCVRSQGTGSLMSPFHAPKQRQQRGERIAARGHARRCAIRRQDM